MTAARHKKKQKRLAAVRAQDAARARRIARYQARAILTTTATFAGKRAHPYGAIDVAFGGDQRAADVADHDLERLKWSWQQIALERVGHLLELECEST